MAKYLLELSLVDYDLMSMKVFQVLNFQRIKMVFSPL